MERLLHQLVIEREIGGGKLKFDWLASAALVRENEFKDVFVGVENRWKVSVVSSDFWMEKFDDE
jgi:hypothetical protein